jgi:protein gp37
MSAMLHTALREVARASHIWWGVSVENRKHGLPRVDVLRSAPVTVRFLSIEPLLEDLGKVDFDRIDWVIVGGESGPRARPIKEKWLRSLRDQCQDASVAFFFKQWGGVQKSKTGRNLDGRTHDDFPARDNKPVPDSATRVSLRTKILC